MNTINSIQVIRGTTPEKMIRPPGNQPELHAAKAERDQIEIQPQKVAEGPETQNTEKPSMSMDQLDKISQGIQKYLDTVGRELNFEVNRDDGRVVIKVMRKSDGTLIRQIPPENIMRLIEANDESVGLLFEESA